MNILILKDNEAFSKLTRNVIATQHFIAYGDGPDHFLVAKDRFNGLYGARISVKTLNWHLEEKN